MASMRISKRSRVALIIPRQEPSTHHRTAAPPVQASVILLLTALQVITQDCQTVSRTQVKLAWTAG
jgi:hypothetical protein